MLTRGAHGTPARRGKSGRSNRAVQRHRGRLSPARMSSSEALKARPHTGHLRCEGVLYPSRGAGNTSLPRRWDRASSLCAPAPATGETQAPQQRSGMPSDSMSDDAAPGELRGRDADEVVLGPRPQGRSGSARRRRSSEASVTSSARPRATTLQPSSHLASTASTSNATCSPRSADGHLRPGSRDSPRGPGGAAGGQSRGRP
jgi:hypothetical protein